MSMIFSPCSGLTSKWKGAAADSALLWRRSHFQVYSDKLPLVRSQWQSNILVHIKSDQNFMIMSIFLDS